MKYAVIAALFAVSSGVKLDRRHHHMVRGDEETKAAEAAAEGKPAAIPS